MRPPEPVLVLDLFPAERARLLDLRGGLSPEQWSAPTACEGWSVKDVASHLLADDLGRLSRERDGYRGWSPLAGESLLAFINRQNAEWVQAMRRVSPRVLCDLLRWSGKQTAALFASLDPFALGGPVSWVGPDPAPVWLDIAREYTERWHHQQHIREAVGAPGLSEPRLFAPVLATFVRALPRAFGDVDAAAGVAVHLHIHGQSGGHWSLVREPDRWALYAGAAEEAAAHITLDEDVAWRVFTRGVALNDAARRARLQGDKQLARRALAAVAIIA